jgi:malate dehydrogenase
VTGAAIIGAGDLGGAVAHALAARDAVDRVLLVDGHGSVAAGKALDIRQAGAITGFHTELLGTGELSRIAGATVCIVADRAGGDGGEWRGDEGHAELKRIARYAPAAPIVFAGCAQAELMRAAAQEARIAPDLLIGSSPEALRSAARAIVALEVRCSPSEVMLTVVGAPGGFVVPWSEASIGGYALQAVLTPVQLQRIERRTERLWPLQPYALGAAAAAVTEAVVHASRHTCCVLTLLEGEFGVRGRVGALPALLSRSGIVHRRTPTLSTRERVQVETALGGPFA